MATRAKIGLLQENGLIKSVYHHWDGYPEWLGLTLIEKYTDVTTINNLLDGGDISTLESDQDWDRTPLEKPIVLYYKDRGEKDCNFEMQSYEDFFKCERGEEYVYLFKNNEWFCFTDDRQPIAIKSKTTIN